MTTSKIPWQAVRCAKCRMAILQRARRTVGKPPITYGWCPGCAERVKLFVITKRACACREAQAVLLDRLSTEAFRRFMEMLDKPPASNPKLKRLLHRKAPWDR